MLDNSGQLDAQVYRLPDEIDQRVAALKLESMGMKLAELTDEQRRYLSSWQQGT